MFHLVSLHMSQPRPLHVPFTSSFLTHMCDAGLAMPGNLALNFRSSSEHQKMPTRKWSAELAPKQGQATGGMPMQGNPRCLATWTMKPQMGKKCVWHSHFCGILALVPSAEALSHCR